MEPTGIIVLGTNGNCIDIADAIAQVNGFLDDNEKLQGKTIAGLPVLGRISDAAKFPRAKFVNGIGSPRSYRRKPDIIASAGIGEDRWATVVHSRAAVSPRAKLGKGAALLAGVSVGTGACVGNHVMVLQNSVISHDAVVGDYAVIATGVCISGSCVIGANCYLGSNCSIREGLRIGESALVGMGAVVTRDVPAGAVVTGNPARARS